MGWMTTAARMWLTRSFRPFTFQKEYDQELFYEGCENLGLYIHIPFCRRICSFCPYCKEIYRKEDCDRYVDALLQEIHMAGRSLKGRKKQVTSLYFGGGTPALASDRLEELLAAVRQYFDIAEGIGMELHPEDVNQRTLRLLKNAGVTKISIGIQSFGEKFLSVLGRPAFQPEKLRETLQEVSFDTVSMDFIFALPGQTLEDLIQDLDMAASVGANHVAVYPFIDFAFTDSRTGAMPKKEKRKLLGRDYAVLPGEGVCKRFHLDLFTGKGSGIFFHDQREFSGFWLFRCNAA